MSITVAQLKDILNEALDELEDWDEDCIVRTVCNTYHLHGARYQLSVGDGYIALSDLDIDYPDEEDE